MGNRHKRNRQAAASQLYVRAQRELAKGNAKEALKDAKVCYRSEASAVHRQLLEQAYLSRAEQLYGKRLLAEAGAVLDELAALVPTAQEINRQLVRLRALMGHGGAETAQLMQDDPTLVTQLIDQAVLDSSVMSPLDPDVLGQVRLVRESLVDVERGEDAVALDRLKDIARTSPLCDWRLFVRGLSAFYQRDQERCEANWQRLDAARPARRLAQTLQVAAHELAAGEVSAEIAASAQRVIQRVQPAHVTVAVEKLIEYWQHGEWRPFLREFRTLRQSSAKTHPKLIESIMDIAWKRAVRESDDATLDQLMRIGPAPPLDPRWHRAQALIKADESDAETIHAATHCWLAYAEDISRGEMLPAAERPIAVALVYQHLAQMLVQAADHRARRCGPYGSVEEEDAEVAQWRDAAVKYYEKSIESYDRLESAYTELVRLHERRDAPAKGAAVYRRMTKVLPDHYEAHCWLGNYHLGKDDVEHAEHHVAAAERLEPRNERTCTLRWNQQLTRVRCLTKQRRFAEAHRALDQVAPRTSLHVAPYAIHTLRAAIELKAKRSDAARQHLDAALDSIEEPTAVWLQMSLVAARYGLPRDVKKEFDQRYKTAIARPPSGQTAGHLARLFMTLHVGQVNYTGRATQERLFLKYLDRAHPRQFAEQDLCSVCQFLATRDKSWNLRNRFVTAAVRQFPDCPELQYQAGDLEMGRGPFACDFRKAKYHLQRALQLAGDSHHVQDEDLIRRAQADLAMLSATAARLPFLQYDEEDTFDPDEDEDGYDDDECDGEADAYDDDPLPDGFRPADARRDRAYADMCQTMPPELAEVFETTAAQQGIHPMDMIESLLGFLDEAIHSGSAAGGRRRR